MKLLVERGADPLCHPAGDLAIDDHRVDHRAAVLDDAVVENFDHTRFGIDRNHRGMGRIAEDAGGDGGLLSGGGSSIGSVPGGRPSWRR